MAARRFALGAPDVGLTRSALIFVMDSLRTDVIELQKARSDLLKWKLLIVAGVGGVALGLSGQDQKIGNVRLALVVIPVACAYVDLLCRHLSLRITTVRIFIANRKDESSILHEFEGFYSRVSEDVWSGHSLESLALIGSTLLLCLAVVPVGILVGPSPRSWCPWKLPEGLFYASSLFGILLASWIDFRHKKLRKGIKELLSQRKEESR